MRTSRLNTFTGGWPMRTGATVAAMMALALTACGTADYVTDSRASVLMIIAAINDGAVLDSDVRNGVNSTVVCPDTVNVSVAVRNKNPNVPSPRVPGAVLIQRYEVQYFRSDGRSGQGLDVPYTISGPLATAVDVADSGTTEVPIEVVRRQAKLEPPLSNITGFDIVSMTAVITLAGETVSGDAVTDVGRMQIDFADFGDSQESCE